MSETPADRSPTPPAESQAEGYTLDEVKQWLAGPGAGPPAESQGPGRVFAWLKGREREILLFGIGLQMVVLLGLIIHHALPLWFGDTVLLRVVPRKPYDPLRRGYVTLRYDFSRIPPEGIQGLPQARSGRNRNEWLGRTVYVSLVRESEGEHWRAEKLSIHRPKSGKFLRGTLVGYNRLKFGIESYYLQESTHRIVSAEVAVLSNGRAKLRRLRFDPKPAPAEKPAPTEKPEPVGRPERPRPKPPEPKPPKPKPPELKPPEEPPSVETPAERPRRDVE